MLSDEGSGFAGPRWEEETSVRSRHGTGGPRLSIDVESVDLGSTIPHGFQCLGPRHLLDVSFDGVLFLFVGFWVHGVTQVFWESDPGTGV